jgi:Trypsin-like peptidase domain
MCKTTLLTAVFCLGLTFVSLTFAQDAVPTELLARTFFIKVGNAGGTAFTIDWQSKLYLVTAKHVITGLPDRNSTIQVRQNNEWKDLHIVKTVFPSAKDVDIAVLETDEKVTQPFVIRTMEETGAGLTMGQQVWFLGYPFEGLGSRFGNDQRVIPFIKKGTMSAIDGANPDAIVLYIDGFNNPGFSGGPIVFWDFTKHAYQIAGVVRGYREDTAKVLVNGEHKDTQWLVNSGILVSYSIKHAIDAIKKDEGQQR